MARRFAGSWLARAAALASRAKRDAHGLAVVEFAIMLPVLMTVFYGCIEATRFILVTQKAEKLAHTVADVTAQSTTATIAGLNQLLVATNDIMNPFGFTAGGCVHITSLYRRPDTANAVVNWRHTGGGELEVDSAFGPLESVPVMPAGFTFDARENVIAAEVFFQWTPLISNQFFGTRTIYRQAFYKPRFGALTEPPT